ncbi:MAG TPA: M4 family metallopeptidase [Acidimicrobiales bacterium]|nr:M4 family metallopeptidase [Acidimicrobiales bacterium]
MPTDQRDDGLSTFSMHAFDSRSSTMFDDLREERSGDDVDLGPPGAAEDLSDLDPETAARRHLDQVLASAAVPALTAPTVAGDATGFSSLGATTVPLTRTRTVKFRQMVGDIPIYGSLVTVELDEDNDLVSIDSALGQPEGVSPEPEITADDAAAAAAAHPGYHPRLVGVTPELQYYFDRAAARWRLAFLLHDVPVEVDPESQDSEDRAAGLEPPRFLDYVVDAHDGSVVAVLPRTPSATTDSPAALSVEHTAVDGFGVERTFRVSESSSGHVLRDEHRNVETYDFAFGDPSVDEANLPGTAIGNPPEWAPEAVSAHANAVAVADFLNDVLLRNNIDDAGGALVSTINCVVEADSPGPQQWVNAFWSPVSRQMVYGQVLHADGLRSLSCNLDVVAHEIFHGVTDVTARLEYADQPGALNESYSDIFGIIITNLDEPDPRRWDWKLGERLLPGDVPFRDLEDPTRHGQPAHMDDFMVLPNTQAGDWGGVHINSGIPNKAAHLMLTAEDGVGDLVLTPQEVAAVLYLALTQRLSMTSQFSDSRRAVEASARTYFRSLAPDEMEAKVGAFTGAFDAVGITG